MSDLLSPRLGALQQSIEQQDSSALATFWAEIEQHGTPIIEPGETGFCYVTFLWRDAGNRQGVDVIQDWGADGIREHHMEQLVGTDVWFYTRVMKADTRTTYQLAPDPLPEAFAGGVPFIPDPLNPKRFSPYFDESGFTIWFSLLELPDAPAQPWKNAAVAAGSVTLYSPFEDGRRMWVYVPADAQPSPYSMLVVFDGRTAKDMVGLPQMLDFQIAAGKIRPTVAVMIDNPDRKELTCDPAFADYVAQKVVPWARENFPVTTEAARTVVCGSSYGGLCAAYVSLRHPTIFGTVLSQTGWFRWHPEDDPEQEWLARQYVNKRIQTVLLYLDVGKLETARMLDGGSSQLVANRHMRDVLQAKGYIVHYREYSGGHDYSSTQSPLFEALPIVLR
jgi:enterochelin esterase-like enzyme